MTARKLRIAALAAAICMTASAAFSQSTVNPNVPAPSAQLNSAPIRSNFGAAYNDITNILKCFAGATAPASPLAGQCWTQNNVTPWVISTWDGTTWVQTGSLNPLTHVYSPVLTSVSLATTAPVSLSFSGGAATLGLNLNPLLGLDGSNRLTLANQTGYSFFGNADSGSPAAPAAFTPSSLPARSLPNGADLAVIANQQNSGQLSKSTLSQFVGGGAGNVIVAAGQPLAPTNCTPQNLATVPFPVILDGVTVPNLATHSMCPQFPFTAALAEPTAVNVSFFNSLPAGMTGYGFIWGNRCNTGGAGAGALCTSSNQANTPLYTFTVQGNTSATTAGGNAVLTFTSTPTGVVGGNILTVTNLTHPSSIPGGTTINSVTGTTATMSANAASLISSGDTIVFTSAQYRWSFSTVAKADACTQAQVYGYYGNNSLATTTLTNAGMSALNTTAPFGQLSGGIFTDVCWLAYVTQPANVTGVILDYEVSDNRPFAAPTPLTTLSSYIHSQSQTVLLYVNTISTYNAGSPFWTCSTAGAASGICSGASTNAPALMSAFDMVGIIADTNVATPSDLTNYLQSQVNQYGATAPMSKVFLQAQIGGYSLPMITAAYQFAATNGLGAIDLWNNGADFSSYSNVAYQQARCLVYGNPFQCGQPPATTSLGIGIAAPATGLLIGNAAPLPTGNGQAAFGASSTLGNIVQGQGSVNAVTLRNEAGATVCQIGTGTTTLNCAAYAVGGTTITFPATPSLVSLADAQTLTNKAISGASNTLSNIASASLSNTGVSANTYGNATQSAQITINAQGQITAASNLTITPVFSSVTGQATLAQLPNIATSTVLGNFGGSTVAPSAVSVPSCANDTLRALTNNAGSGFNCTQLIPTAVRAGDVIFWNGANWTSLGGNQTNVNMLIESASGTPSWARSAILAGNPANPTGTVSLTAKQMGIGGTCAFTPSYSTRARIVITASLLNSAGNQATAQISYGTGVAPANAAAPTGTTLGSAMSGGGGNFVPLTLDAIVTGLTVGTAYWIDTQLLSSNGANTASISNVFCYAHEVI